MPFSCTQSPGAKRRARTPSPSCLPRPTLLAIALQGVLLSVAAGAAALPHAARAQTAEAPPAGDEIRSFDVPAGPLDAALDRYARIAGVNLSYDAALLAGLQSKGLSGDYRVAQALRLLLAGSGLEAVAQPGGGYSLRRLPAAASPSAEGAVMLPVVKVAARIEDEATEGTGSYRAASARTATGLALAPRETPQSVTVVTHDRMRDQDLTQIADVMQQIVGVESNSTSALGSDGTVYYARGFAVQNYQVDGISRPANVYGFAEETADMIAYDRIEVVRGASGLMTGEGVPSATINLIRKRPTAETRASIAAKAGSWDLYRVEGDAGGSLIDSGRVRARVSAAYQQNDAFVDREAAERKAAYGVIEADLAEPTLLTAGLEYQDFRNEHASRGGVPLYYTDGAETHLSRSTNTGANWSDFAKDSLNAFVSLQQHFGENWRATLDAEHKQGSYDESIGYLWATALDRNSGAGGTLYAARWARDLRLDGLNGRLQGAFDWLGHRQQLALTLTHAVYTSKGPGYPGWWSGAAYAAPVDDAFALYATGDVPKPDLSPDDSREGSRIEHTALSGVVRLKPLEPVAVILGSRVTRWKSSDWSRAPGAAKVTTPGADESGVWTPYAGLVVDLTKAIAAYASYTSIFEPQTLKEVSGKTLRPLDGDSYELGLKTQAFDGRLDASAALFRMKQQHYGVPLGAGIYAPDGSIAYREAPGATSKGVELEIAGEPLPGWKLAGGFTHVDAEDHDGQPLQPDIPENTFKLFSTWRLRGALKDLVVGGNLRWQDRTIASGAAPDGSDYRQGALFLVDLQAQYRFAQHVSLALHARNLLDKTWYSGLSAGGSRYGEPRNFSASLRYDFF